MYTTFLSTAISWLYARAITTHSWWRRANLVPLLGALFDTLENLSTSLVMWRYPQPTAVVDVLAFTLVKWLTISGSFVLLVAGGVAGIWRWRKRPRGI